MVQWSTGCGLGTVLDVLVGGYDGPQHQFGGRFRKWKGQQWGWGRKVGGAVFLPDVTLDLPPACLSLLLGQGRDLERGISPGLGLSWPHFPMAILRRMHKFSPSPNIITALPTSKLYRASRSEGHFRLCLRFRSVQGRKRFLGTFLPNLHEDENHENTNLLGPYKYLMGACSALSAPLEVNVRKYSCAS